MEHETSPMAELSRRQFSTANRIALWVVMLGSIIIVIDMVYRLYTGEGYQWIRHSMGLIGLAWAVLMIVRVTRASEQLLAASACMLIERFAPADWNAERRDAIHRELPYFGLALRYTLFGQRVMLGTLRRELKRAHAAVPS